MDYRLRIRIQGSGLPFQASKCWISRRRERDATWERVLEFWEDTVLSGRVSASDRAIERERKRERERESVENERERELESSFSLSLSC